MWGLITWNKLLMSSSLNVDRSTVHLIWLPKSESIVKDVSIPYHNHFKWEWDWMPWRSVSVRACFWSPRPREWKESWKNLNKRYAKFLGNKHNKNQPSNITSFKIRFSRPCLFFLAAVTRPKPNQPPGYLSIQSVSKERISDLISSLGCWDLGLGTTHYIT